MSLQFYFSGGGSLSGVLGGAISSTQVTSQAVFPNVSEAEALTGITQYSSIYVKNTGVTTITNVGLYFSSKNTASKVYVGKGITSNLSIPNQNTAPSDSIVFDNTVLKYAPLVIASSLAPNASIQIWLKRVFQVNSPGSSNDYFILSGTFN